MAEFVPFTPEADQAFLDQEDPRASWGPRDVEIWFPHWGDDMAGQFTLDWVEDLDEDDP